MGNTEETENDNGGQLLSAREFSQVNEVGKKIRGYRLNGLGFYGNHLCGLFELMRQGLNTGAPLLTTEHSIFSLQVKMGLSIALFHETVGPFSFTMQNPQDLNRVFNDPVRDYERRAGDH